MALIEDFENLAKDYINSEEKSQDKDDSLSENHDSLSIVPNDDVALEVISIEHLPSSQTDELANNLNEYIITVDEDGIDVSISDDTNEEEMLDGDMRLDGIFDFEDNNPDSDDKEIFMS